MEFTITRLRAKPRAGPYGSLSWGLGSLILVKRIYIFTNHKASFNHPVQETQHRVKQIHLAVERRQNKF